MVLIPIASVLMVLVSLWAALGLWFQLEFSRAWRWLPVLTWLLIESAIVRELWRQHAMAGIVAFLATFGLWCLWWQRQRPSNERAWADEGAQMSSGRVEGGCVVLHNVRNFAWRSTSDYTQRWETRRYDLTQLVSVDLILSYWTVNAIAHVLISFGFADGQHVVFSVEIRRKRDDRFSAIGGFFKAYELSVIAADERDVVRVRTNVRREDDYLYRIRLPHAAMQSLFLAYVEEANTLVRAPRFYNTLTVNCTTLVYQMMKHIVGHLPWDIRLLLSGYLAAYVYRVGGLDTRYSLAALRAAGRITERARAADDSASFSADIRRGVPELAAN